MQPKIPTSDPTTSSRRHASPCAGDDFEKNKPISFFMEMRRSGKMFFYHRVMGHRSGKRGEGVWPEGEEKYRFKTLRNFKRG